jgi:hypothetical protein
MTDGLRLTLDPDPPVTDRRGWTWSCRPLVRAVLAWLRAHRRVYVLRRALTDAVAQCPICQGTGRIALMGEVIACTTCAAWRRVLRETAGC